MTIVFKVSDNIKEKMIEYYQDKRKENTPAYAIFQAQEEDTVITLYSSGKVVFQGISADVDANMWIDMEKYLNNRDIDINEKEKQVDKTYYYYDAIGSDEVGTGDYFLPIVVTASFVRKSDIKFLEKLKISDSKKMTDDKIRRCAPILINKIKNYSLILTNKEYNEYHNKSYNMNKIKAILHNKVLYKLVSEKLPYQKIIVDQFAFPKNYFNYIKDSTEKVTNITFLTKAESKNLSVAVSSVISRYIFLQEAEKLSRKYNMNIPKGAGNLVDKVGKEIVEKYGKDILKEISKISFKNTEKILN